MIRLVSRSGSLPEPSRSRVPRLELIALMAGLWAAGAVLESALLLVVPGSALSNPALPHLARSALLGSELVTLAFPVSALAVLLTLPRALAGSRSTAVRAIVGPACLLGSWFILFFATASWMSFLGMGQFLGLEELRFWWSNPHQVFQHAAELDPEATAATPILSLILWAPLALLLPRAARRWSDRTRRLVSWAAGMTLMLAAAIAWKGASTFPRLDTISWDRPDGLNLTLGDLYLASLEESSGAGTRLVVSLWTPDGPESGTFATTSMKSRRPLVTSAEYLGGFPARAPSRPSVLLIVIESLRSDELRAYGGGRTVMPAVEALSREARVYTNHYTTSSQSNLACVVPLSGQYPLRARRFSSYPEEIPYPRVLLYDLLRPLGYRTAIFSSQNESWGGMRNFLSTDGLEHFLDSETYDGPTYVPHDDVGFARFVKGSRRSGKIDDRYTITEAIEWLDLIGESPFLIYMNLQKSHVPYEVPLDFRPVFGRGSVSFPVRFNSFPPDSAGAVRDLYSNSLAYVDHQLDRLFSHLKATGRWDSTVVVVTGDHGQAFYEHGFSAHANQLYEELLRTPLLIRAPWLPAGLDDRPAQHVDVAPTILGLLGLPPHPGFQGLSLLEPVSPDRPLFSLVQTPLAHQYAIVQRGRKLIYDVKRARYLAYDLSNDPGETSDLARGNANVFPELRQMLEAWRGAQLEYYGSPHLQRTTYAPAPQDYLALPQAAKASFSARH